MKCSICQNIILNNERFGYEKIEGKIFYFHLNCIDIVDDIMDEDFDEESFENIVIITDEVVDV